MVFETNQFHSGTNRFHSKSNRFDSDTNRLYPETNQLCLETNWLYLETNWLYLETKLLMLARTWFRPGISPPGPVRIPVCRTVSRPSGTRRDGWSARYQPRY